MWCETCDSPMDSRFDPRNFHNSLVIRNNGYTRALAKIILLCAFGMAERKVKSNRA